MGNRHKDNVIRRLGDLLHQESGVVCAYLFGSTARGEDTAGSDLDLALLTRAPCPTTLLNPLSRLQMRLEDALRGPVDLVDLRTAPPDLVHRILRDGILVVDRAPNERIAFEVQARNDYFDLLPHLQEYRRTGSG